MQTLNHYREDFLVYMGEKVRLKEPSNLYEPILYMLNLGGKRVRPILVLLSTEIFGTSYKKALDAALAIEMFHNFSLIHDDIMDDAPVRRGKTSVYKKWDLNTAILSGDAMLIIAYKLLENYEGAIFKALANLFTETAIKVCEGQQYDIDFENRDKVSVEEYLQMIEFKTAVLLGAALKMGAIVAKASEDNTKKIYEFGKLLGIAFQLQDDYLDIFGDPEAFGKQIAGDIIENKKTFLFLKALEQSSEKEAKQLRHLYELCPNDPSEKIVAIKTIFEESGAVNHILKEIEIYTQKAFQILNQIDIQPTHKEILKTFGEDLMNRKM